MTNVFRYSRNNGELNIGIILNTIFDNALLILDEQIILEMKIIMMSIKIQAIFASRIVTGDGTANNWQWFFR